jgi:hypothetical protein
MQMQRCACSDSALQRPAASALRVSAMPEGASQSMLRGAGTSESGDEPGVTAAVDNSAAEGAQDGEERSRLAALAAGSMRVSFATPPPRQVCELRHVMDLYVIGLMNQSNNACPYCRPTSVLFAEHVYY